MRRVWLGLVGGVGRVVRLLARVGPGLLGLVLTSVGVGLWVASVGAGLMVAGVLLLIDRAYTVWRGGGL